MTTNYFLFIDMWNGIWYFFITYLNKKNPIKENQYINIFISL